MSNSLVISCVAVVGPASAPLYVRYFEAPDAPGDGLRFHYLVHTALDAVDEKISAIAAAKGGDVFLGYLCPFEDFRVYGYVTNTYHKFLVAVSDISVNDQTIKGLFKTLHCLFADAISNPFYKTGSKISSQLFDKKVLQLVHQRSPKTDISDVVLAANLPI